MNRTHPAALFATGTLGACLAFLALGPGSTDAGPEAAAPPAARAGDVSFDADIVRHGKAVAVRVQARSAGARDRHCRVTATLLRSRDERFSRVIAMPDSIWSDAVALRVPARGRAVRELRLPAVAAAKVPEADRGNPEAPRDTVGVTLVPVCSDVVGVG